MPFFGGTAPESLDMSGEAASSEEYLEYDTADEEYIEEESASEEIALAAVSADAPGEMAVSISQQTSVIAATSMPEPTIVTQLEKESASAPDTMLFEDYGVNPFVDTATDNLSTFALDVDTGSYTVMRNYVNDGLLPPQEAVRVEEFVNYFDYRYEVPSADEVFAIHLDMAPAPWATQTNQDVAAQLLRIGIQGNEIAPNERKDVALTFVIDVSGSMDQENRLTLAKRSLNMLVEELRPSDSVGIVVYGSNARTVLAPTSAAKKNAIADAIFSLRTEGSTNAEAGLKMGYRQAWEHFNPQVLNRVILVSDGVANVGATGPGSIWEEIKQYAERGITLTSVGMGMGNYNDVLMEQLANMGDGTYAYVDNIDEAHRIFVDELTGTLQTIAKDAKIQVEFNPGRVASYRLIGYENRDVADQDFRNDSVDAGEVGAGHSVTALYELVLSEADQSGDQSSGQSTGPSTLIATEVDELLTVHLRWQEPDGEEVTEIAQSISLDQLHSGFKTATPSLQLAASVAQVAEILRGSHWTDESIVSAELVDELYRVQGLMDGNEQISEFIQLAEMMASFSQ